MVARVCVCVCMYVCRSEVVNESDPPRLLVMGDLEQHGINLLIVNPAAVSLQTTFSDITPTPGCTLIALG